MLNDVDTVGLETAIGIDVGVGMDVGEVWAYVQV